MNDDDLTRALRGAVPPHRSGFWEDLERNLGQDGGGTPELDRPGPSLGGGPGRPVAVPSRRGRRHRGTLTALAAAAAVVAVIGAGAVLQLTSGPTQAGPGTQPPSSGTTTPSTTPAPTSPPTSRPVPPPATSGATEPSTGGPTSPAGTPPSTPATSSPAVPKQPSSSTVSVTGSGGTRLVVKVQRLSAAGSREASIRVTVTGQAARPTDATDGTVITNPEQLLQGQQIDYGDGGADGSDPGSATCGAKTTVVPVDTTAPFRHTYTRPGTYTFRYSTAVCVPGSVDPLTATTTLTLTVT